MRQSSGDGRRRNGGVRFTIQSSGEGGFDLPRNGANPEGELRQISLLLNKDYRRSIHCAFKYNELTSIR
ncbi:unnamed protein product [Nippostrongylus brasiliensis]|uniref:RNA helicase n=1 Tax=Nippostrongylus brasiliensis TaxID=27835 RepID=A0A0N4YM42_NIPBR|nr:unnamed protein product [Nippostrongylus brasiliensis]